MSEKFNTNGNDLDRPDLNKCPDCLCYFAGINCPLCGKPCPEHMKAGNRKIVRPVPKKASDPNAGRVIFVPWYHSMWFMILVTLFSPLVGIILFATSHHKRVVKIIAIIAILLFVVLSSVTSYSYIFSNLFEGNIVDRDLSREEYVNACEDVSPSDYFRSPDQYKDKYVTMSLSVSERFYDASYYYASDYYVFYVCTDPENPEFQIMIRDCVENGSQNFIPGDTVVIYGEGTGALYSSIDLNGVTHSAPLINVAYYELVPSEEGDGNSDPDVGAPDDGNGDPDLGAPDDGNGNPDVGAPDDGEGSNNEGGVTDEGNTDEGGTNEGSGSSEEGSATEEGTAEEGGNTDQSGGTPEEA